MRPGPHAWLARCRPRVAVVAASIVMLWAALAVAGSYLDRCVLIVGEASRESSYLQHRLHDRELAAFTHKMAVARLTAAREMSVPKEVAQAHPHLLLMLENYERSADAARVGENQRFIVYQRRARDEEQVFRAILEQLGFPLPDRKRKRRGQGGVHLSPDSVFLGRGSPAGRALDELPGYGGVGPVPGS